MPPMPPMPPAPLVLLELLVLLAPPAPLVLLELLVLLAPPAPLIPPSGVYGVHGAPAFPGLHTGGFPVSVGGFWASLASAMQIFCSGGFAVRSTTRKLPFSGVAQ